MLDVTTHRAQNHGGELLCDVQQLGVAILNDGHVTSHHVFTEIPADARRAVLNVLTLLRRFRVLIPTLQKLSASAAMCFDSSLRFAWRNGTPR